MIILLVIRQQKRIWKKVLLEVGLLHHLLFACRSCDDCACEELNEMEIVEVQLSYLAFSLGGKLLVFAVGGDAGLLTETVDVDEVGAAVAVVAVALYWIVGLR